MNEPPAGGALVDLTGRVVLSVAAVIDRENAAQDLPAVVLGSSPVENPGGYCPIHATGVKLPDDFVVTPLQYAD